LFRLLANDAGLEANSPGNGIIGNRVLQQKKREKFEVFRVLSQAKKK